MCTAVIAQLLGEKDDAAIVKAAAGTGLEPGEARAAVATTHFILHSAGKYGIDAATLTTELQQLGLPKGSGI